MMIIKNGLILTMDAQNRVLHNRSIVIRGNRIEKIAKTSQLDLREEEVIDGRAKIVVPGFVSAHTHSIHSLLRGGKEEGKNLYDWLGKVVFPGLKKYKRKDVFKAAQLWHKEATRSGITCLLDSSDYGSLKRIHEPTLEAHQKSGKRVVYGRHFFDRNPNKLDVPVESTEKALHQIERLIKRYNHGGLVKVCPSPGEATTVSKEGLAGSLALARKYNVPVTLHASEVRQDSRIQGRPTMEYLHQIGFLSERTLLAHCVWVNPKEIQFIQETSTKVAHNPTANAFLADGVMPLDKMLNRGITVGVGLDDPNCNSNVNMLSNLKTMCLVQKSSALNPKVLMAQKAIRMATIESAKCVGLEKEIGSIEVGKKADIILVETNHLNQTPFQNPYFNLVYQCYGNEIAKTIIDGKTAWSKEETSGQSESLAVVTQSSH